MSHKALHTDSSQVETINHGEKSMKPELLANRDAGITTDEEESVRARAYELYELYEVRGRMDGHAEGEAAGRNERKAVRASTSKITVKIVGEADGLDDHVVESDAQTSGGKP